MWQYRSVVAGGYTIKTTSAGFFHASKLHKENAEFQPQNRHKKMIKVKLEMFRIRKCEYNCNICAYEEDSSGPCEGGTHCGRARAAPSGVPWPCSPACPAHSPHPDNPLVFLPRSTPTVPDLTSECLCFPLILAACQNLTGEHVRRKTRIFFPIDESLANYENHFIGEEERKLFLLLQDFLQISKACCE